MIDVPEDHQSPPYGFVEDCSNVRVSSPTPASEFKHETPHPRTQSPYSPSPDNSDSFTTVKSSYPICYTRPG